MVLLLPQHVMSLMLSSIFLRLTVATQVGGVKQQLRRCVRVGGLSSSSSSCVVVVSFEFIFFVVQEGVRSCKKFQEVSNGPCGITKLHQNLTHHDLPLSL